jgi:hypothetical protein
LQFRSVSHVACAALLSLVALGGCGADDPGSVPQAPEPQDLTGVRAGALGTGTPFNPPDIAIDDVSPAPTMLTLAGLNLVNDHGDVLAVGVVRNDAHVAQCEIGVSVRLITGAATVLEQTGVVDAPLYDASIGGTSARAHCLAPGQSGGFSLRRTSVATPLPPYHTAVVSFDSLTVDALPTADQAATDTTSLDMGGIYFLTGTAQLTPAPGAVTLSAYLLDEHGLPLGVATAMTNTGTMGAWQFLAQPGVGAPFSQSLITISQ